MIDSIDREFSNIFEDMSSLKEKFISELEGLYRELEDKDKEVEILRQEGEALREDLDQKDREIESLKAELENLEIELEEEDLDEASQEDESLFEMYNKEFLELTRESMGNDSLSNKLLKEFLEKFSELLDMSIDLEESCGFSLYLALLEILNRKYYATKEVKDFLSQNHKKFISIFQDMGPRVELYQAFIIYGNILILSGLDLDLDMDGYKEILLDLEPGMLSENKVLDYTYLKFYLGYRAECKADFDLIALYDDKYIGHRDFYLRYSSPYIGEDDFVSMEDDFEDLRLDVSLDYKIIDLIQRDILASSYENFTDSVELINDGRLKCPKDGFELSKREAKLMFRENEKIQGVLDKELYYCSQCENYFIYRKDSLPLENKVQISDRFYDDCFEQNDKDRIAEYNDEDYI